MSKKYSVLFCWNSKCQTSGSLYSGGTACVQQIFHSILLEQHKVQQVFHFILLERQVSKKFSTLFWLNSKCPTIVALCSGGTASVHKYFTLFWWNSKCPASVPLYSTAKAGVQQVSHSILLEQHVSIKCPTLHFTGPDSRRDVLEDPGSNSYHNILSGLLQCVANFHILPQASSLINSLCTSWKTHRISNTRQTYLIFFRPCIIV